MHQTKILLNENDIPRKWYNILPDMPTTLSSPLNPATKAYDSYFSGNMFDEPVKNE